MSLVWPAGLLFLLALPIVLWLHARRRRERQVVVTSVTPWLALRAAVPPRRRRIPASLLLLLHLLFAMGLALAIAGPVLPGRSRPVHDRAIVLDTSTSMLAGDRWMEAQARARELIDATQGAVTLVALGPQPRVVIARDVEGSLAAAAAVAGPDAEIVVVTDGGLTVPERALAHRWEIVGDDESNVAIETSGVDTSGGHAQVFVRIAAFGDESVSVPLTLGLDGREADRLDAAIGGDGTFETVWTVPSGASTALVRIESGDDLAADDEVQIPLEPHRLRVEFVGDSEAVERVLSAMPHVALSRAGPGTYRTDGTIDATVFVGSAPEDLPPGGVIIFGPPAGQWTESGVVPDQASIDDPTGHPLAEGLDLAGARIARASTLGVPEGAAPLLEADGATVAVAGTVAGSRTVVLGFDPDGGDVASRLAFPLLVARAVEWVAPERPPRVVAAGEAVPLPPGSHEIRGPGVSPLRVRGVFEGTERPGVYSATSTRGAEPRVVRFAVAAGDAAESDLSGRAEAPEPVVTPGGSAAQGGRPVWPWLAAAALAVALAESLWRGSGAGKAGGREAGGRESQRVGQS
jgi:hypothetical protein